MQAKTIAALIRDSITNPYVFSKPVKYLWLFSHMRSRSTLLSHILGSHAEIAGYRERHASYQTKLDLMRLRYRSWCELQWRSPSYLLDKLLHNDQAINFSIFDTGQFRSIIFVRSPEPTIKSIVAMGRKKGRSDYGDINWATEYYIQRVRRLIELSQLMPSECVYCFDSDDFVSSAKEQILGNISDFLSLSDPLTEHYQMFETTGVSAHGDPSKYIKSGKVLELSNTRYEDVVISEQTLIQANETYIQACEEMNLRRI